jgi:hypothetical protein
MPLLERQVKNLNEILTAVEEFSKKWNSSPFGTEELWFRGVKKKYYQLLPGIHRKPREKALPFDEVNIFERFKALATPYTPTRVMDDWEWYFLAQHHRLPTRLLDWTENILAAIYFAIAEEIESNGPIAMAESQKSSPTTDEYGDESPVIWVLDAGSLNSITLDSNDDAILCPGTPFTNGYLPDNIIKQTEKNKLPFSLLPIRANSRIIAQQGMFTIHGYDKTPIEDLIRIEKGDNLKIGRIEIDRCQIYKIWSQVERMGINRLSLFPDLDSVSFYIRWISEEHES